MSQKLPVNNFEWIKDDSQFNEDFIENCSEESNERYFLEADVQYHQKLLEFHNHLPFLPERMKIEKVEKLYMLCYTHKKFKASIKSWISFEIMVNVRKQRY